MKTLAAPWRLFQRYGVELEYMVVSADTLAIEPCVDRLLRSAAGANAWVSDVERGDVAWSNELVAHVVELKTAEPAASLAGLAARFQDNVAEMLARLAPLGARLMPAAMHPWMDPLQEARLWPHDYSEVYAAYDRIFDCRGHGWSNLQSAHLNLPFRGDEEFGKLHAAIRLLLPLLPALAASSPAVEGRLTGLLDTRLETYRANSLRIPSLTGDVIPEPVYTHADYDREILQRMYADVAPHDPEGVLRDEFLNSRGAIARFERGSIEIRVLDVQECPAADLAVCAAVVAVLRALVSEKWTSTAEQQSWPTAPLAELLSDAVRDADEARIDNADYLHALGIRQQSILAGEAWARLLAAAAPASPGHDPWSEWRPAWQVLTDHGPLARRIVQALGPAPTRADLTAVYSRLCDCLAEGRMFVP